MVYFLIGIWKTEEKSCRKTPSRKKCFKSLDQITVMGRDF